MKDAAAFDVEGLVKGYLRGTAWHCTFYTPAGRQRRKLGSKNKRQAERRAREIAEFIQREIWEALSKLDWKSKPHAGTFSIFVRDEFLPKYCTWSERTRQGEAARLRILCEQFGALPLSAVTASAIKTWLSKARPRTVNNALQISSSGWSRPFRSRLDPKASSMNVSLTDVRLRSESLARNRVSTFLARLAPGGSPFFFFHTY